MRRLCLALFLVLGTVLASGRAAEPKRNHTITIDDYFSLATPTEVAVSGQRIAYAEARWQKSTNDRKADLWVIDGPAKPRRLTMDRVGARSIHWGKGGREIYYIGQRKRAGEKEPPYDGKPQVWRVNVESGRSTAITRVSRGVAAYQVDRLGAALYYVVNVPVEATGPFAQLKKETKEIEYEDGSHEKSQLWKLDLQSWRSDKLLDDGRTIREISLELAGERLAMITTPDDTVVSFEGQSRVEVFDLATRKATVLPDKVYRADAPSKFAWLEHLSFGSQGLLAFNAIFDGYPAEIIVGTEGKTGWVTWKVKRPEGTHVRGYGSPLAWESNDTLYFLGEKQCRVRLCQVPTASGQDHTATYSNLVGENDDIVLAAVSVATHFKSQPVFAAIAGTSKTFREVYLLESKKKPRQLTQLNPQTDTWKLPKVSTVTWKGANGDEVHGVLEVPAEARPGQPLPLIVGIHGGPTTATLCEMEFNFYEARIFLPALGYAVLCPNYRGSTGNGDKFLTDLIGKENDLDVKDILAGVDALVERKVADPERLGVMGWSNGGYLTNCILTKTTRFKAAISGAGIVDTVMEWGSNDEPAYMNVLKGGLPWDKPDVYRRTSPTYQLNKIRTPTLIHVGGSDVRCPPSHSRTLYRALKLYNKVPTELVSYTGEPHGLTKYANRRAKMAWDVAWFNRYVLGK